MIFTVAQVLSPTQTAFDPESQELTVQYHNPHRASGGRTLQVRFPKAALKELLLEIRRLEAAPEKPLERLFAD
ncbi:hypothetical protein AOX61_10275 [Pseudomonas aeruginosa]|uniref:hypothetical protein n=1 Tax=Pseudomonas aeruginosa TaxID=287 RepID=UPI000707F07C|nr:hypothetical protein [Pseudomonas aeruginosa]KQK61063.1 hypothetical protein AOX61_10275 [Pseudomonas aeruginosa]KQK66964.1 hypothetical protein AOX62_01665 [Pseudomonas aeruginosa]